jgi:hypothetical protein
MIGYSGAHVTVDARIIDFEIVNIVWYRALVNKRPNTTQVGSIRVN